MPFKVVQTIENGAICLSIVPEKWEDNGTLCWPPRSQAGSMLDEHSVPGKTWSTFPCVVKRTYKTYKAARSEVKRMENVTDTEEEVPSEVFQRENDVVLDFNNLMQVDGDSTATVTPNTVIPSDNAMMADHISFNDVNTSFLLKNDNDEVIKNQGKIMEMLQDLQITQKKILLQLAKQEVQNAELHNIMADANVTAMTATNRESSLEERFTPVNTVAELLQLEDNLKKIEFRNKYFKVMSTLCSPCLGAKGTKVCYKIIDFFFSREFFTLVSWSGNSRDKNEKAAFKCCTNIRHVFYSVIHTADPNLSHMDTDNFIKGIIRNSRQRFQSTLKPVSSSTPENRKKRSKAQNAGVAESRDAEPYGEELPTADVAEKPTIRVAEGGAEVGDAEVGVAEGGAEVGDAEVGDAEVGNAEVGDAEVGGAEVGGARVVIAEIHVVEQNNDCVQ